MSGWAWNVCVLTAVFGLWLSSGTQRERPLVANDCLETLQRLEANIVASPDDETVRRELVQAYLDARNPGMAVRAVEAAPEAVRVRPRVEHLYARALAESGQSGDALRAQRRALAACSKLEGSSDACDSWFIAAATRRADIFEELVRFGIEDAQAYPERSAIAYHSATRQARLAVQ
jgi:predicted Zn-dependent protease